MFTTNFYNFLLNTDSYKTSHWVQYPPQTQYVSSYIEPRGGDFDDVVFFGLQAFIKEYLTKPITQQDVDEAGAMLTAHGVPFNKAGWEHIVNKHNGLLPVRIEAVKEGSVLKTSNVVCQVVNTDPECYWLTSYIETALLRGVWYPSTVATLSYQCKKIIAQALEKSADSSEGLPFKLHDFGARGVSSMESSALGGLAHIVNFMGTDTVSSLVAASRWYGMDGSSEERGMSAFSIPASEHSTITSWGRENESDAFANMLTQFGGKDKLLAVVSDSYDLWSAIENIWGDELKEQVENMGGTLVVRPDSGDPVAVVKKVLDLLASKFGTTTNSKGYKMLPDCVRVIQGDGINVNSLQAILDNIMQAGYSADNIAFGMGGGLLQQVNRDTLGWAMKASAACVDGQWRDVYKDPITGSGKRSKRGVLALVDVDGEPTTIRADELGQQENLLVPVYENGKLLQDITLTEVRANVGF